MRRQLLTCLVTAWLALNVLTACGGGFGDPWPHPMIDETAIRLHELVNEARATARSCGSRGWFDAAEALVLEPRLTRAAQLHSDDMHATGVMSHTGSDGSSLTQRLAREGYAYGRAGENVAWGYATPEAVVAGWLGSDGHCANLMGVGFTDLGAGESGRYWTLVFARPQ